MMMYYLIKWNHRPNYIYHTVYYRQQFSYQALLSKGGSICVFQMESTQPWANSSDAGYSADTTPLPHPQHTPFTECVSMESEESFSTLPRHTPSLKKETEVGMLWLLWMQS